MEEEGREAWEDRKGRLLVLDRQSRRDPQDNRGEKGGGGVRGSRSGNVVSLAVGAPTCWRTEDGRPHHIEQFVKS